MTTNQELLRQIYFLSLTNTQEYCDYNEIMTTKSVTTADRDSRVYVSVKINRKLLLIIDKDTSFWSIYSKKGIEYKVPR